MIISKIKSSPSLSQILLNFIDVLRINILIVDHKGTPLMVPKTNGYGFYGASQWGVLRYLGKPEFLSQFQTEGYYLKSIDDFGFQSFAIPIAVAGFDAAAYLILGPVILDKQLEQSLYQAITRKLGINFADFLECLIEVRVVSFNSFKSVLDLLFELSQYALKMGLTENGPVAASIFTNLLDLSMALTQAEYGSIMLLNKTNNELSIQVFKGINLHKLKDVPVKLGEGIAGLAAQQKESFVINDGQPNNRVQHLLKRPELKCALVLPIIDSNQEVLGVMNLSTQQETSRLATHSQEMLKSLIEITSGTISSLL